MPKVGSHHSQRGIRGLSARPRDLAILALEGLVRYAESGLSLPGDTMHKELATRLAEVAAKNRWEG